MIKKRNFIDNLIFYIFILALCLNCLFITFYFNKWTKIYYLYFLILFLFFVVSFYFKFIVKDIDKKINYLTVFFSLVCSLILAEFILVKSNNLVFFENYILSKKFNVKYDFRSKLQVIRDGENLYPSMHVISDKYVYSDISDKQLIPLSGLSYSNTVLCNENGFWAKYNSDRYGFRNPNNIWDEDDIEYLIVGDSYAHGACVKDKNTFRNNLERFSGKKVINLGIGGNGPLMTLGTMIEYGFIKKPNKIIWIFNISDLSDITPELNNKILIKYLNEENFSQNLKNRGLEIDQLYNDIISDYFKKDNNFFKFFKIRELTNIVFNTLISSKEKNKPLINDYMFDNFKKVANKIIYMSKLHNSELYVVYIPIHWEYSRKPPSYKKYRGKTLTFFKSKNIKVIDLHEEKWSKDKNLFDNYVFGKNLHFTPRANDEISEIILKKTNF